MTSCHLHNCNRYKCKKAIKNKTWVFKNVNSAIVVLWNAVQWVCRYWRCGVGAVMWPCCASCVCHSIKATSRNHIWLWKSLSSKWLEMEEITWREHQICFFWFYILSKASLTKPHSTPGEKRRVQGEKNEKWQYDEGEEQEKGKDVRVKASKMGILPRDVKDQGMETVHSHQGHWAKQTLVWRSAATFRFCPYIEINQIVGTYASVLPSGIKEPLALPPSIEKMGVKVWVFGSIWQLYSFMSSHSRNS